MRTGRTIDRIRGHLGTWCTAATSAGLLRYVRKHPDCLRGLWPGYEGRRGYPPERCTEWRARRALSPVERERRRCGADRVFRAARLRELRRECRVSAAAYTPERWAAAETAERAARALGLPARAEARDVWAVPVGLGDLGYSPTARDASVAATLGLPRRERAAGETQWKNGVPKYYTRAQDDSAVLSAAALSRTVLRYWYQEPAGDREVWTHSAPEGCRWERDQNGLRLVCGPDDYHPTSRDLRGGTRAIVERLRSNAQRRRETAARTAAERAALDGVLVCLADSLRAGNCRSGSVAFAARHGLDLERHYGAVQLLAAAGGNGDSGRVRLAIRAAAERTRREAEAGACVLADHVV